MLRSGEMAIEELVAIGDAEELCRRLSPPHIDRAAAAPVGSATRAALEPGTARGAVARRRRGASAPGRVIFLDLDSLLHVATRALGSDPVVRDYGLLQSALARPQASSTLPKTRQPPNPVFRAKLLGTL
jgi:hypothetical protein